MENEQALKCVKLMRECTSMIGKHFIIAGRPTSVIEISDDNDTITKQVPVQQSPPSKNNKEREMHLHSSPKNFSSPTSKYFLDEIECILDDDGFMYFDLADVPTELFCFFHERSEQYGNNKIAQPPFNHHSINHANPAFRKMFEKIRNGKFDDNSPFHFVFYNIKRQESSNMNLLTKNGNRKRRIQPIEIQYENKDQETTCTHFSYANAISNATFVDSIMTLIFRLKSILSAKCDGSGNNINRIRRMDRIFRDFCNRAINKNVPKEEIFMDNVTQYQSFFDSTTLKDNDDTYSEVFVDFQRHVHKFINVRLGTLEGIHRLYGMSYVINHKHQRNDYITKGHSCRFTNMKETSSEEEWNKQIRLLKRKSSRYERKKSLYVPISGYDILEEIIKEVNRKNDVCVNFKPPSKNRDGGSETYFGSFIFPILKNFVMDYLKEEALGEVESLDEKSYDELKKTEPILNNPIIHDCYMSSKTDRSSREHNIDKFWRLLLEDSMLSDDSKRAFLKQTSFNIATLRFGNHFKGSYKAPQHINFLNIFRIKPGSSKAYRKQHFTVHAMRNLLIFLNICKFCRESFIKKAAEANLSHQQEFNNYLFNTSEDNNVTKLNFCRVFDVNLIGKYKVKLTMKDISF